jgi:hypothetical protein
MKQNINLKLVSVAKSLESVRETLLECSHKYISTTEDNEWDAAESLFTLAKSADGLRRQVISVLNGAQPSNMMASIPTSERELGARQKVMTPKPSKKRKEDYPKYSVRSDSLLKIGLGRDRKTEYEQIVPKLEFNKIIDRLSSMAGSYDEFTYEDVQQELECPMYQTYIVLSLLRQMELLDLPRRGIYRFHSADTFVSTAPSIWSQIQQA